jgi:CheY-like chemotaxis protein
MSTIIIVDDDATNTSLLQMLLELDGYSPVTCRTIDEAKTAVAQGVDAFVIDCYLAQGISGLSLLREIRQNQTDADPNTIVIMVSGDHRLEQQAFNENADHFLLKPYAPAELTQTIQTLLAKKESSGQNNL